MDEMRNDTVDAMQAAAHKLGFTLKLQSARALADAVIPIILAEASKVAREYKASLRPGSEERLLGQNEAAKDIATAIHRLADQS